MTNFSLYIFIAAMLHVAEEYIYPGGFLEWAGKHIPKFKQKLSVKFAVIVNGLFLLLCGAGVLFADSYPVFALSIAGLVTVNGAGHIITSIFTKSYSQGLITSIILYLPISIYIFISLELSTGDIITIIFYGVLYHSVIPLFLFAPFNKPKAIS